VKYTADSRVPLIPSKAARKLVEIANLRWTSDG
jgi:hypothetical protein